MLNKELYLNRKKYIVFKIIFSFFGLHYRADQNPHSAFQPFSYYDLKKTVQISSNDLMKVVSEDKGHIFCLAMWMSMSMNVQG